MPTWIRVKASTIQEQWSVKPHKWKKLAKSKFIPWDHCTGCGLILLNNEPTRKIAKRLCLGYIPH